MAVRIGNITFDCDDVLKMAAFWSAVLGRPLDKGSNELFASIGGADGGRGSRRGCSTRFPGRSTLRTAFTSIW
jgi:catechol 2,3-dioxygenase-like lactoylglutathione lyase family enzyme